MENQYQVPGTCSTPILTFYNCKTFAKFHSRKFMLPDICSVFSIHKASTASAVTTTNTDATTSYQHHQCRSMLPSPLPLSPQPVYHHQPDTTSSIMIAIAQQ